MLASFLSKRKACYLIILLIFITRTTTGFNVDVPSHRVFRGPPRSYFGYSIKFHNNSKGLWLLVGGPRANTSAESTVVEPGGLFTCNLTAGIANCPEYPLDTTGNKEGGVSPTQYNDIKDHQWMGVTLDATTVGTGNVMICGHRWANRKFPGYHLANGACYVMDGEMTSSRRLLPIVRYNEQFPSSGGSIYYNYAYGQAGISVALSKTQNQNCIVGAPGIWYWKGAVVEYSESIVDDETYKHVLLHKDTDINTFAYLGYSVAMGQIFSKDNGVGAEQYVASAPRLDSVGSVIVFEALSKASVLTSPQFGSYFGGALCVVDLNNDGLEDLLVGAPMYTIKGQAGSDHGAVFMYLSSGSGQSKLDLEQEALHGSRSNMARFGHAIASAGKLNDEKINDFIVGAPYENDGKGAIYIYHGTSKVYTQRLAAQDIDTSLRTFGSAITADMDIDGNKFPDVAVGAYESSMAVLFLSRPVVHLQAALDFNSTQIDIEQLKYSLNGQEYPAVAIGIAFRYDGRNLPSSLEVQYKLDMDTIKGDGRIRGQVVVNGRKATSVTNTTTLSRNTKKDTHYIIVFDRNSKDIYTTFQCKLSFGLINAERYKINNLTPILSLYNKNETYKEINFLKKCGSDEKCDSDLNLDLKVLTASGKRYIIMGEDKPMDILIILKNRGEAAYQSEVTVAYPSRMVYRYLRQEVQDQASGRRDRVSCMPSLTNKDQALLRCETGNPLNANQTVTFKATFDVKDIQKADQNLTLEVAANTSSNEVVTDNNKVQFQVPFIIQASVTLNEKSKTDQLKYENSTDIRDVIHIYDIRNQGPGAVPKISLILHVPHTMKDTNKAIIGNVDIKMTKKSHTGQTIEACKLESDNAEVVPSADVTTSERSSKLVDLTEEEAKPIDFNCNSMKCKQYKCELSFLAPSDNTVIEVNAKMDMNAVQQVAINRVGHYFTGAVLTVTLKDDKFVTRNYTQHKMARTTLYPKETQRKLRVKWWVIAAAAGAGLLMLILVAVLLSKFGFFKRNKLEDRKKLIQENQQNDAQEAEAALDVGVNPPTQGGRDDMDDYEQNKSNNANKPAYTASSRNGPMYGNLSMIDDTDDDDDNNNANNNNSLLRSRKTLNSIEEDGDEDANGLLVYSINYPPPPPVPNFDYLDDEFNLLARRPPPPRNLRPTNMTWSKDGYLLPAEQRHL